MRRLQIVLKCAIVDLSRRWAWHPIFQINLINGGLADTCMPNLVRLVSVIAEISVFKRTASVDQAVDHQQEFIMVYTLCVPVLYFCTQTVYPLCTILNWRGEQSAMTLHKYYGRRSNESHERQLYINSIVGEGKTIHDKCQKRIYQHTIYI